MRSVAALKTFAKAFNETGYQEYYSDDGFLYALEKAIDDEIWGSDEEYGLDSDYDDDDYDDEYSSDSDDEDDYDDEYDPDSDYGDDYDEEDDRAPYTVDVSNILMRKMLDVMKSSGAITGEQYIALTDKLNLGDNDDEEDDGLSEWEKEASVRYELACDEDVAQFYFLHSLSSKSKKAELLAACIDNNDKVQLNHLLSLMEETQKYEDYDDLNGWGRDIEVILCHLIEDYDHRMHRSFPVYIPGNDINLVCGAVDRMLPILSDQAQRNVKHTLLKLRPDKDIEQEYITQLLEDAHIYVMKRKPRGKGGAPNTNRMSDQFIHCFERLERMNRLDVVLEIMSIFKAAGDIKPVTYESWLGFMRRGLSDGAYKKVSRQLQD